MKHSLNPLPTHFETSTRRLCTLYAHKPKPLCRQCGTSASTLCTLYAHKPKPLRRQCGTFACTLCTLYAHKPKPLCHPCGTSVCIACTLYAHGQSRTTMSQNQVDFVYWKQNLLVPDRGNHMPHCYTVTVPCCGMLHAVLCSSDLHLPHPPMNGWLSVDSSSGQRKSPGNYFWTC